MEEIKKITIQDEVADSDTPVEVVESEDVVEVALAESESVEEQKAENAEPAAPAPAVSDNSFEYTDGELSGLTAKQKKRNEIFDKITTGILIALMATPAAVVLYIFLWFILR